jgi:hypothetical protein
MADQFTGVARPEFEEMGASSLGSIPFDADGREIRQPRASAFFHQREFRRADMPIEPQP